MESLESLRNPPGNVSPASLFRTLLQWRPRIRTAVELHGFGSFDVDIVSLPSHEFLSHMDHVDKELRVISAVLYEGSEKVFDSPEHAGRVLMAPEVDLVFDLAIRSLFRVCPMYCTSNMDSWSSELQKGAMGNDVQAVALAACAEYWVIGDQVRVGERPERFWGKPLNELLDGHWMVYRAAMKVLERERKKNSNGSIPGRQGAGRG